MRLFNQKKYNMKPKYTLFIISCLFSVLLASCDLTKDLDDYEPLYSLPAETAIADESSAELALTGVYAILQQKGGANPSNSILGSTLSGIDSGGFPGTGTDEDLAIKNNAPLVTGRKISSIYSGQYVMINRANWVINGVEKLTDKDFINDNRRLEILGEAKILRAMGHFYLLRVYGQFYDINSEYGINVRMEPAKDAQAQPRISVGASYDAILKDLDEGIAQAPILRKKYFVNKAFAKGLKAKVLLYMGRYAEAAAVADEVIKNSGADFALETSFNKLFDHSTINTLNNKEALFEVYADTDEILGNGSMWTIYSAVSNWYYNLGKGSMTVGSQVIKYDGTRTAFMNTGSYFIPGLGFNGNMKFAQLSGPQSQYETLYHLRMAEVYLIYAEALARSTKSVPAQAIEALNKIRTRAGALTTGSNGFETYPSSISYAQFLEAVRIEKLMELGSETGEEWYDLVRYDYSDGFGTGFKVSDVKATAVNSDFFIMPIPDASVRVSKNVVKQNPGY